MKILDEAIEVAAMAILAVDPETWALQTGHVKDRYRWDAQVALEAAAPYLMAQAWDEGLDAARAYDLVPNPYRPDAEAR